LRRDRRLGSAARNRCAAGKALGDLDCEKLTRVFAVNIISSALVAKHFLPLPCQGRCHADGVVPWHSLLVPATCASQRLELISRPAHAEKRQGDMHRGEQNRNVGHFSALSS
jgi:hypothetical protein